MTIHQAKGLEWPVVFVPSLVRDRFPTRKAGVVRSFLVPDTLFDQTRYNGGLADERKLFYVAATRARDALVVSYFRKMKNKRARSVLLDEIGAVGQPPIDGPVVGSIPPATGGEEDLVGFSATELIEYLRCPTFYRLKNVWDYQRRMVPEIGFGKSLHHVLRVLAERTQQGDDPQAIVAEVLEEHFHLPFGSRATRAVLMRHAGNALDDYIRDHLQDLKSVKEVEARLEFQLTKTAIVTGRVDVIIGDHGDLEVRDYKSTDVEDDRSQREASFQVKLYAVGLDEVGQPVKRASVANVLDNIVVPVPLAPADMSDARSDAESAVAGILARNFTARAGKHCAQCGYQPICRFTA